MHTYYIKNNAVEDVPTPKSAAWAVRKIFETRSLITNIQGIQGNLECRLLQLQRGERFSIKKLYILQLPQHPQSTLEKHCSADKTTPKIQIYQLASFAQKTGNIGEANALWDTDSTTMCIMQASRRII